MDLFRQARYLTAPLTDTGIEFRGIVATRQGCFHRKALGVLIKSIALVAVFLP